MRERDASGPGSRRRWVLAGAAVAALLLGAALTAVFAGSAAKARLLTPVSRPDPVPTGPVITSLPKNCGVSPATARSLAPGSRLSRAAGQGECLWYSLNAGKTRCGFCPRRSGDRERVLSVELGASRNAGEAMTDFPDDPPYIPTPLEQAMSANPPRNVAGLGDEAIAYYSPDRTLEGALIVLRAGNVIAKIRYYGSDALRDHTTRTIARTTAIDGAFKAASEVAKGLGTAARPTWSPPPGAATPIRSVPRPCDTVPGDVLDLLVPDARRTRGSGSALQLDRLLNATSDTCEWDSARDARRLSVTVGSVPGAGTAAREYLRLHRTERAAGRGFKALTGPGQQAYCVNGRVVFRVRNLLVEVAYSGTPVERATDGAYTAAVPVAKALTS